MTTRDRAPLIAVAAVLSLGASLIASSTAAGAEVQLATIFGDHAVLQCDRSIPIWGTAGPGQMVSVTLGDRPPVSAATAADGRWTVTLPAMPAGGPYRLVAAGADQAVSNDILVGEVWLCSGQSNMEFTVDGVIHADQEKAAATDGQIRQLYIPRRPASQPMGALDAHWTVASAQTVGGFTACGYFMARTLRKEIGAPVGLINASWGGTRIEPWTPRGGFALVPQLSELTRDLDALDPHEAGYQAAVNKHLDAVARWVQESKAALAAGQVVAPAPAMPAAIEPLAERKDPQQQPTTLYNGMIHGLVGYGMRGAIWYQGESNHGEGMLYTEKMKALIGGWRKLWGIGDFPFYFVQIAPFSYGEDSAVLPKFWVAQSAALAIPNTGMVVTNDIGTLPDIHPKNKQEVGRRLALLALSKTYGKAGVVCEGPTYRSVVVEGAKMRVTFDHASGLATRDGMSPTWFEILGDAGDFTKADAVIDGDSVVLSAAAIQHPLALRFAWSRDAEPNLANAAGLPASAFQAGGVPYVDHLAQIDDAKAYRLVYAIDCAHLGEHVTYDVDQSAAITMPFDRIAYFFELQQDGRPVQYAWASMDAFTSEIGKIAIPTLSSGAFFQRAVANMTVVSNVKDVANGTFADGGNIEFWPNNYGPANSANVANASSSVFDFGDQPSDPQDGYGSMQVHNHAASQTIFALNHWRAGAQADLGIGSSTGETRDWTFAGNAGTYTVKKLRVLVRPKP
jgi:sialate O-acetylesterase